jgi:peptidoglycan/LPS O-acetylase OafA/YrhL
MKYLSDYTAGRDNNFNLLRFVAASAVLVSHSYILATGDGETEPLWRLLGMSFGEIAIGLFFVTSGFLVTGSLVTKCNATEFFLSRALRIYPGLWVAILLTVAIFGLVFSELSAADFFTHGATWRYVITNMVMLGYETYLLPGTFRHLPFAGAVNGSLWSLPFELRMYLLLGFAWVLFAALNPKPTRWLKWFCIAVAASTVLLDLAFVWIQMSYPAAYREPRIIGLGAAFFSGAALRVLQDRIPVSRTIFFVLVAALAISAATTGFQIVYKLTFAYVVLYLALVPRGWLLNFNRLGDYSYGIYIYAFAVQQSVVYSIPGITPIQLIVCSFPPTLGLAVASWYLIEKRALRFRPQRKRAAPLTPVAVPRR